jgi:hypothetical protein
MFIPAHLPGLVALLTQFGQSGLTPLGATVQNDTDFSIPLASGYYLKASFGEDAGSLIKNLNLLLVSDALQGKTGQLEYVDLRFGDHLYYKVLSEAQASSTPQ